jgi:tetratricopeptide (TPR) repeat protein
LNPCFLLFTHICISKHATMSKQPPPITFITPCSRPHNLPAIHASLLLQWHRVNRWIVVFDAKIIPDADAERHIFLDGPKIEYTSFQSESSLFGNGQRNHALASIVGRPKEFEASYIYFLDEDNVVHPELWNLDLPPDCSCIVSFDQYFAKTMPCVRRGDCLRKFEIDTAQVLVGCRTYLTQPILWFEMAHEADGMWIEVMGQLFGSNHIYIPRIAALYNPLREEIMPEEESVDFGTVATAHHHWPSLSVRPIKAALLKCVDVASHLAGSETRIIYLGHTCRGTVLRRIHNLSQPSSSLNTIIIIILEPGHQVVTYFAQPTVISINQETLEPCITPTPPAGFSLAACENLINVCIMVKDAGDTFESMLRANMHVADRWTILDTGSTDGTQDVVRRVLGGQRYLLAEEPFINFRDSRNRCLELAGTSCTFNLMLDDTYIVRGDLRKFLQEARTDEFATSYCLFIRSDDVEYQSNRITRSESGLRYMYTIHEVIQLDRNNNQVVIPLEVAFIEDVESEYMDERTSRRKQYDLERLEEMIREDPDNPRHLYYMAQTYSLLRDYEKAAFWFKKRYESPSIGLPVERMDAACEYARILNFKMKDVPWEVVEKAYMDAYECEPERPEALYFIGIHYWTVDKNPQKAFQFFSKAFKLGYASHTQVSLKPTLVYYFLPVFLTESALEMGEYEIGLEATARFLAHINDPPLQKVRQQEAVEKMIQYRAWLTHLETFSRVQKSCSGLDTLLSSIPPLRPAIVLIADGNWKEWDATTMDAEGLGGSETWAVELSRAMSVQCDCDVVVFCKKAPSAGSETFLPISHLYEFLAQRDVLACIVSRYAEYIPLAIKAKKVRKIIFALHDIAVPNLMIPKHPKLERIVTLTPWHRDQFLSLFPEFESRIVVKGYGFPQALRNAAESRCLIPPKRFIYSSFPNRGLVHLLRMWPDIRTLIPDARLDVFADLDGEWANLHYTDTMCEIKSRVRDLPGVVLRGWVGKKELYTAWAEADVWLYPCVFEETFCLTALEAASSRTLCIVPPLAALRHTVRHGIVVEGDPGEEQWKRQVLERLREIVHDPEKQEEVRSIVRANYMWVGQGPWARVAREWLVDILGLGP